jgi:manganese oxidase
MTITDQRARERADERPAPVPPAEVGAPLSALIFVGMVVLVVVVVLAVMVLGVIAVVRASSEASPASLATTLDVGLSEFEITGDLFAPAGQVTLRVANDGSIEHNLSVLDTNSRTANLAAGASESLSLGDLAPGVYQLICTIPGHADSGMKADLTITDAAGDPTAGSDGVDGAAAAGGAGGIDGMDGSAMTGEQMDQLMVESMLAFPAETDGVGNQPLEYEVLPDGTKQFELTAAVTPWEVSPGKIVDAWTYNGTVPGPMIKVDVGDTVRVILHNDTPMGTDIHFHGIDTPNDQDGVGPYTQDVVSSGESFTYEFTTTGPMIGMYHAHMHGQVSVVNGMFASFVVGDDPIPRGRTISGVTIPADLVPAVEVPMVINDAGVIGLTLNGKSFPATTPIVVDEGDWVAVNYYNEGLTAHPMHLHKFPQLVYAKDGIPLDQPYFADTINIAPGERYSVLFHADEAGTWVWHCHILTHAESETGMFGMVTAVVVNPMS